MAYLGLFAGLDSAGAIRFVGDVPRGLACGCFCPGCGSPLVAKRGETNIWHFAHEASQERPECLIGAANLLRRLSIEQLQMAQHIDLPPYTTIVQAGNFPRIVQQQVTWSTKCDSISGWAHQPAQKCKVAQMLTDNDVQVVLYVDVASRPNMRSADVAPEIGEIHFLVPPPEPGQLRALTDALAHISKSGRFHWIYLPDVDRQVTIAQEQVNTEAMNLERESEAERLRQEKVGREVVALRRLSAPGPEPLASFSSPQIRLDNPSPDNATPWAIWRKSNTTFMFYGLHDETGWMVITHQDGRLIAVPWPFFEGWDEALPDRFGKADPTLGGIFVNDFSLLALYLRDKHKILRFSTTWQDILNLDWSPSKPISSD